LRYPLFVCTSSSAFSGIQFLEPYKHLRQPPLYISGYLNCCYYSKSTGDLSLYL